MKARLAIIAFGLAVVFTSGCGLWPFKSSEEQLSAVYIGLNEVTTLTTDLLGRKLISVDTAKRYRDTIIKARGWAKKAEDLLASGTIEEARGYIKKAKAMLKDIRGNLAKEGS